MKRGLLATALAGAMLLAGCGIPENTEVSKVSDGPRTGASFGQEDSPDKFTREEAGDDTALLVKFYLQAAAASDPDTSLKQVQSFLSPSFAATTLKAPTDVKVIHLIGTPLVNPGSDEVKVTALTVGVLSHNGVLEASEDKGVQTYSMTVSSITGKDGLFVTKAPPVLLLTDEGLEDYYHQHTIYFWNRDHTALVPDVRYLSADVPSEQVPQEIVKWMIEGPASWLAGAAEPLPDGTALIGNVPAVTNNKLQINLSGGSAQQPDAQAALDRLRRQLMWSLRQFLPRVLELKVGNGPQTDYESNDYYTSNASYRLAAAPERFVIYNEQIRRVSQSAASTDPIPVIRPENNRKVRAAALARSFSDRGYAALVTSDAGKQALQVGSAPRGEQAKLHPVPLPGGSTGQPVWAITSDDAQTGAIGLITVGGRLYSFSPDDTTLKRVNWPGPSGLISAVSVAPDGRRLALVVNGELYVAAMTADGSGPALSTPRRVEIYRLTDVTAADWGTESSLIVAGTRSDGDRVAIIETELDGARSSEVLADIGNEHVSYLAAYPVNPITQKSLPDVMEYMANGATFDIQTQPFRINVTDLADPVTNPPPGIIPISPFFLR
jgi:hypothetical protein